MPSPTLAWVLNICPELLWLQTISSVFSEQQHMPDDFSCTETSTNLFGITLEWHDLHCTHDGYHNTSMVWKSQCIENPQSVDWSVSHLASLKCTERRERSNYWVQWLAFSGCQLTLPGPEELWSNFHFKETANKCKQSVSKATVQVLLS